MPQYAKLLFMHLLISYIKQYKSILIVALVLATINQVFSLLDPLIFRFTIDKFASNPSAYTLTDYLVGAGILILASVGVAFVSRVAKNYQDYYTTVMIQRIGTALYTDTLAHAFSLPFSVFEDERSGALLEKLNKARQDVEKSITSFIGTVFFSLIGIIFVLIYSFFTHWSIAVAFILMIPLIGTLTFTLGKKIKELQTEIVKERSALAGSSTDTIRNVELVKSLGLESQEVTRLREVSNKILELELSKVKYVRMLSFIQGTVLNLLRTILIFLMMYLVFQNALSVGQLFSVMLYSFYVFGPLYELGTVATNYYEAKASLLNVSAFLDKIPDYEPENPKKLETITHIQADNISFRYKTRDTDALTNIVFEAKKGETIAFVGPSGSGKSTIVKLLTRLYMPDTGMLSINDTDYKLLGGSALRQRIGLVTQETQLFAGTIGENLRFAKSDVTDEEANQALREAQAFAIIERTGEGLDTRIGEGGVKLSGGERQRLAIARALIRKPEVLIFDEATSALDSITEHAVSETIRQIGSVSGIKPIQILIAHRLSTVSHADRIYVLEKGQIVESGTHNELLKKGGLYHALWREQGGK